MFHRVETGSNWADLAGMSRGLALAKAILKEVTGTCLASVSWVGGATEPVRGCPPAVMR